ncbi:hypothetical protein B9Z65_1390 [Elsinoe australis]|uniref:Scytalone dehydratase-like domain-containing protein n=1 Tax=Elsinoe australis TaxID=40998 RepID=A0A2P7YFR7_9PEZI|nr:hypothetical protein B9Z65_1390 [Elsinoe australis]
MPTRRYMSGPRPINQPLPTYPNHRLKPPQFKRMAQLSLEDVIGCQAALFEWTESYDLKDWERLRKCIAPELRIDYSSFWGKYWEAMPSEEYVAMVSSDKVLGNRRLKTQHFVGVSKWVKSSELHMTGRHQMRVAHQKYTDVDCQEVELKGHAHGTCVAWCLKVDDKWKFSGIERHFRWSEYDYEKMCA